MQRTKQAITEPENQPSSPKDSRMENDQSHDKFDYEPKKQDSDNGEQRDLMEEALEKWEAFQNKQNQSSQSKNE
jgi:hypothetical protein